MLVAARQRAEPVAKLADPRVSRATWARASRLMASAAELRRRRNRAGKPRSRFPRLTSSGTRPRPADRRERKTSPTGSRRFRIGWPQLRPINRDRASAVEKAKQGRTKIVLAGIGKPGHAQNLAGTDVKVTPSIPAAVRSSTDSATFPSDPRGPWLDVAELNSRRGRPSHGSDDPP